MLFFKLQGICDNAVAAGDRQARKELARKISLDTSEFNSRCGDIYAFVSEIVDDTVTMGLITRQFVNPRAQIKEYTDFIGLDVQDIIADEITLNKMENLLSSAGRYDYIDDEGDVMEQFELDKITGRVGRGIAYGENLTKAKVSRDEVVAVAKRHFMADTAIPEIDRIFGGCNNLRASGHPVHYIVECDDRDTRREIYKALLDALYTNYRLESRRYAFLDFRPGENYSKMAYEVLCKVCRGGAVVVRYLAGDDTESDGCAGGERETVENICEMAKRYRNEVLTVICFPRECTKIKALFYEYLGTMSFVEVREDFIGGADAKAFLSSLAKQKNIRSDKRLLAGIDEEKTYLAGELTNEVRLVHILRARQVKHILVSSCVDGGCGSLTNARRSYNPRYILVLLGIFEEGIYIFERCGTAQLPTVHLACLNL